MKCKEKFVILQSIGIIAIKSSETNAVINTYRYSSGQFNPYKLSIRISAGVDDCPCFNTFLLLLSLLILKLQIFPYTCLFECTSATSKNKRIAMNIIFVGATPTI